MTLRARVLQHAVIQRFGVPARPQSALALTVVQATPDDPPRTDSLRLEVGALEDECFLTEAVELDDGPGARPVV